MVGQRGPTQYLYLPLACVGYLWIVAQSVIAAPAVDIDISVRCVITVDPAVPFEGTHQRDHGQGSTAVERHCESVDESLRWSRSLRHAVSSSEHVVIVRGCDLHKQVCSKSLCHAL